MTYAQRPEQVLGLLVHIELSALAVLRKVERRHLGHVLILPLTLLFLQLERDTADRALLDALHQVGGVAGDLTIILSSAFRSAQRGRKNMGLPLPDKLIVV